MSLQLYALNGTTPVALTATDGRLDIQAVTETEAESISEKTGETFCWRSSYNAGAEVVLFVQNTHANKKFLYIDWFDGVWDVATTLQVSTVLNPGSVGGSAITGSSLSPGSGTAIGSDAVAYGSAAVTGVSGGSICGDLGLIANQSGRLKYGGAIVLRPNDAIFIASTVAATTLGTVSVVGHYK